MGCSIGGRILAWAFLCAAAGAQVPDGWYVVSGFASPSGTGGLFFVHPRNPGAPIPVLGLGPDLTGTAGMPFGNQGANSVLRAPDGSLIVGETLPRGGPLDLHVLTLTGATVASDTTFTLGSAFSPSSVVQCALLPNGEILVGVTGVTTGPLAGEMLGLVDPATGSVAPIPISPAPLGIFNALAVDSSGTVAFLGMVSALPLGPSDIYSVAVPGGGPPAFGAPVPGVIQNLDLLPSGNLVASTGFSQDLFVIDTATAATTPIPTSVFSPTGVAVESVTGGYAVTTNFTTPSIHFVDASGATTPLSTIGGGAGLSGIDVNPNPEAFGTGTSGANTYSWALAPNPGGLPTVGNAGFSVTVSSTSGSTAGWIGFSSLPGTGVVLFGVSLWIDLASLLFLVPMPASGTLPLPIPPVPALAGLQGYLQTFHLDLALPFGIAASPGLEVTVL